jgi:hypothetical protein
MCGARHVTSGRLQSSRGVPAIGAYQIVKLNNTDASDNR